jgi:hypothetical protein
MPDVSLVQDGPDLKITAKKLWPDEGLSQIDLRIDRQTLRPRDITATAYDPNGNLFSKTMKRWEYQDFSGLVLPKQVVDEDYVKGLDGQMHLTQVRTLTINSFSTQPMDAKEELATLLKSNYSIFDQITGSHYLSGNPGDMLDKLSK